MHYAIPGMYLVLCYNVVQSEYTSIQDPETRLPVALQEHLCTPVVEHKIRIRNLRRGEFEVFFVFVFVFFSGKVEGVV